MDNPLQRLYKTKLALLATVSTVAGFALATASGWTLKEVIYTVGTTLFSIGVLGIFFQYVGAEDQEQASNDRVRRVIKQCAPYFRDAVIDAFAFAPEELTSVASPSTLDKIITNCLTIFSLATPK